MKLALNIPAIRRRRQPLERALRMDETISFESGRAGMEIAVIEGTVWITQLGDPVDHVLETGDRIRLPGRGRIVARALGPARLVAGGTVSDLPAANDPAHQFVVVGAQDPAARTMPHAREARDDRRVSGLAEP